MGINNYLRNPEFEIDFAGRLDHTELPYEKKPLTVGEDVCMVYDIPESDMQKILNKVNPYGTKRQADDLMFDELKGECFKWKQAMVLWYRNTNLLGNDGKKNYFINKDGRTIQSAYQRIFIRKKQKASK